MRLIIGFLTATLSLILFSCDSSLDPYTSLGTEIIHDNDSLLSVFNGKVITDTLQPISSTSFVDNNGSILSGLNNVLHTTIGNWKNQRSIAYMEFNGDSIIDLLDSIEKNQYSLNSFSLHFSHLSGKSHLTRHSSVEIGYTAKKSDSALIDTAQLTALSHYTLTPSEKSVSIPIRLKHVSKSDTIQDTVSVRNLSTFTRKMAFPVSGLFYKKIINKNELSSIGADTLLIDTLAPDTYLFGVLTQATLDSAYTVTAKPITYDSLASSSAMIKKGQTIEKYTSRKDTVNDTIYQWDTVIVKPQTIPDYKVTTTVVHDNVMNKDSTIYQVSQCTVVVVQDSLFQHCMRFPKIALLSHLLDSLQTLMSYSGNTKTLSLYALLGKADTSSLVLFTNPYLSFTYIKPKENSTEKDTIAALIQPRRSDFSVFESNQTSLDSLPWVSDAAGRHAVIELDMQTVWNNFFDNSGKILYKNIPRAELTLYPDSITFHPSVDSSMNIFYTVSRTPLTQIEDISGIKKTSRITTNAQQVKIHINSFLIDFLKAGQPLPDKVYLYLWLARGDFINVYWKSGAQGLPFLYILTNSNQG